MYETSRNLPIADVHPNPMHYREVKPEDVETLAASIAVVGQLEPVTVFRDGEIYVVDSGHHRLAAMQKLGLTDIKAIVLDDIDEATSASVMVASNMHFPESALERSRGTQLMIATGVRPEDAAALIGEDADTVKRVAHGMGIAKDYAEDMSLERIAVLDEFEGDDEAVGKLLTAPEAQWRHIYDDLRRAKNRAVQIEAARAIITEAGCEIIEAIDHSKYEWLDGKDEAPEGAQYGFVNVSYTNVWISWWTDAGEEVVDPEEQARIEQQAIIANALADAAALRFEYMAYHLIERKYATSSELVDLAQRLWDEGSLSASVKSTDAHFSEVLGFIPKVYASLLSSLERQCGRLLGVNSDYFIREGGRTALDYFDALKSTGYRMSFAEAGALERLAEAVERIEGDAE